MSEDLLDTLLSAAATELCENSEATKTLRDVDIFCAENSAGSEENSKTLSLNKKKPSTVIHTGDTDSSDDEDNRYFEERKYNESGRNIKHQLQSSSLNTDFNKQSTSTWTKTPSAPQLKPSTLAKTKDNVDPVFGLRIVNPLISFTSLQDRMIGRQNVSFACMKTFLAGNISDKNWVVAGVIVSKSPVKTSSKGNQFLIWTLSDLKNDIKTVAVFLFSGAYKQLWKTPTGTVVGILNPQLLERQSGSKDEAVLSVNKAQTVMVLGESKDLGTCKSVKKNGDKCTAIVNISRCQFCLYHIKQEYQQCSRRSELQSNFSGKGLTALRNKVLGKNEVFYAGKSYMAIPAKRSKKLEQQDKGRLQALNGHNSDFPGLKKSAPKSAPKVATAVEITVKQRMRDLALLEKLGGSIDSSNGTFNASHSTEVTLESSKQVAAEVIAKLKTSESNNIDSNKEESKPNADSNSLNKTLQVFNIPKLRPNTKGMIDLGVAKTSQQVHKAKLNALRYVQQSGPLKRSDPNNIKKSSEERKRPLEVDLNSEGDSKKPKLANEFQSDRFKKMMEATSKHLDLLGARDDEEQEKYFHKLEMKEQMEEKMMNTFKVPCKAVRCLQCKYTNFSASDLCKENKHPLKVFDAIKRFFKCGNCGNRTVSLQFVPTGSCNNCGSDKWERAAMMKEKSVGLTHTLSIRGGEQTFVNSGMSDSNLDLLVPDS